VVWKRWHCPRGSLPHKRPEVWAAMSSVDQPWLFHSAFRPSAKVLFLTPKTLCGASEKGSLQRSVASRQKKALGVALTKDNNASPDLGFREIPEMEVLFFNSQKLGPQRKEACNLWLQADKRKLLALFSPKITMLVSIWGFTKSQKWRCCQTPKAKLVLLLMLKASLSSKQDDWFT